MKFKLVPVFCGLVWVEFEDGMMSVQFDTRNKADMRLCGIIQGLIDSGFEYEESHSNNETLAEIVKESTR